jgi:hypothetical protein
MTVWMKRSTLPLMRGVHDRWPWLERGQLEKSRRGDRAGAELRSLLAGAPPACHRASYFARSAAEPGSDAACRLLLVKHTADHHESTVRRRASSLVDVLRGPGPLADGGQPPVSQTRSKSTTVIAATARALSLQRLRHLGPRGNG